MYETGQIERDRLHQAAPRVSASDYRKVFEKIYQNRYFTNHGPLAKEFESSIEEYLDAKNVIAIGSDALAVLVALAGLDLKGDLIVPAFYGALPAQIASRLNLNVVFCDVCPRSFQPKMEHVESVRTDNTSSIVLIETFGNRCDQGLVGRLVSLGWKVVVVAFDSFGATAEGQYLSSDPHVVTVYSFGHGKILSAFQGGAIATHNDELAHRFRNIRSSYGVTKKVDVLATCNGRFSEFQAGVGLKSLVYVSQAIQHNQRILNRFDEVLGDTATRNTFEFRNRDLSNCSFYPIRLDRDLQFRCGDCIRQSGVQRCEAMPRSLQPMDCATSQLLSSELFLLPVASCQSLDDATRCANDLLALIKGAL